MSGTTGRLNAALNYLQAAREEFLAFADAHPERMDANITRAMDHTATASDLIDADYYAEREGLGEPD